MKKQIINGYELLEPFQTKNAGFSQYTFAVKEGQEYFIKKLLDPVFPDPAQNETKILARKVKGCREFEARQKTLFETYNGCSDGNAVFIDEFFRSGNHYYLVMKRMTPVADPDLFSSLSWEDRLFFCMAFLHSLMKIHEKGLIHMDLKKDNILPVRLESGKIIGRIIDVDGMRFESDPVESGEEPGGDQVYMAPEVLKILFEEEGELTCKTDVFSAGILIHEYLSGKLPGYSEEYDYPAEALLNDDQLIIDRGLPQPARKIIEQMLKSNPAERISSEEAWRQFSNLIFPPEEKTEEESDRLPEIPEKTSENKANSSDKKSWFSPAGEL